MLNEDGKDLMREFESTCHFECELILVAVLRGLGRFLKEIASVIQDSVALLNEF